MENKPIAAYSLTAFNHIEILETENGSDVYIKFRWKNGNERTIPKWSKVKHDKEGKAYFQTKGLRIFLDECLKVNTLYI